MIHICSINAVRQLDKIELVKTMKVHEGAGVLSLKAMLESCTGCESFPLNNLHCLH